MMDDRFRELRKEAEAIEAQSYKEEGTHAAYLRGYAQGLVTAARRMKQTVDDEQFTATLKTRVMTDGQPQMTAEDSVVTGTCAAHSVSQSGG